MTLSNLNTETQAAGDGSTVDFTINFDFQNNTEIEVILRSNANPDLPVDTTQAITTDYTLTGTPPTQVKMITAPASDEVLIIRRVTPQTQATKYIKTGKFPAATHETALDKLTQKTQELDAQINRSAHLPPGSPITSLLLPDPKASSFLRWAADRLSLENADEVIADTIAVPVSAKGDLWGFNTASARFPVGSNGQNIYADSSQALGIKWAAAAPLAHGQVHNLGIKLDSGTFSITSADLTALSATNFGWVDLNSVVTPGKIIRHLITADATFIDDSGASTIIGELFDATSGRAWDEDRGFSIYSCAENSDVSAKFAISLNNIANVVPATSKIGWAVTSTGLSTDKDQETFSFLTATDPSTAFDGNPCANIGGFRMKMSTLDDWTVQTITSSNGDGIRKNAYGSTRFVMPRAQHGAEAGRFWLDSGQPVWATQANERYGYLLDPSGRCHLAYDTLNASTVTNGLDSDAAVISAPYGNKGLLGTGTEYIPGGFYGVTSATTTAAGIPIINLGAGIGNKSFGLLDTGFATIRNDDFSNSGDDLNINFSYQAFRN